MIGYVSRVFFHTLAGSRALKELASRYGMRNPGSFARRFIAGETIDEAIAAARSIEAAGMTETLDLLGESVTTMAEADVATRAYLTMFDRIVAAGIGRNISLKLTQLGLTIDRATCVDNLRRILDAAAARDFFVRIDMRGYAKLFRTLFVLIGTFTITWASTAAAQETQPEDLPIGRYVADLRFNFPKFKQDPGVASSIGVATEDLPTRGFGLVVGAHWYPLRLGIMCSRNQSIFRLGTERCHFALSAT